MQCPLCRHVNPTPNIKPHIYSVSVVQIGLLDWEVHIRENYFYDYGSAEERITMFAERISSAVTHVKLHGAITLTIVGRKKLLDEIFLNADQFMNVICSFTLLYTMVTTPDGISTHPFLFIQLHD